MRKRNPRAEGWKQKMTRSGKRKRERGIHRERERERERKRERERQGERETSVFLMIDFFLGF